MDLLSDPFKSRDSVPKTVLGNAYDVEALLAQFGEPPVIIKLLQGTHGHGVVLADTYASALSTIETMKPPRSDL